MKQQTTIWQRLMIFKSGFSRFERIVGALLIGGLPIWWIALWQQKEIDNPKERKDAKP